MNVISRSHLLIVLIGAFCGLFGPEGRAEEPQRRLLFNSDGTNLFWREDVSMEMVAKHVAELPTEITTYLLCPNGIHKMMYPSAHEELSTRGALPALVAAGHDPFGAFLEGMRARGFETFITFRMNEVHNVDRPDDPDLSRFWRDHPEYRVERGENPSNWMAQCLDYSLEPVREFQLALITELMEKYRPDGIELDWMRFPRHLSGSPEEVWEKREALTDVVRRVRATADRLSQGSDRRMLVSVRVPTNVAGWHFLGADVAAWNRDKLIDFVTVAPFLASDFVMPIQQIKAVLAEHSVPVYAGIEFGYSGKPHRAETLRGAAASLYACGADGIYLFNFPCWRESQMDPPWEWVPSLAAPDRLKEFSLCFPLIDGSHRVGGIDLTPPLPIDVPPGTTQETHLFLPGMAIADGNVPISVRLVLDPAAVDVTVNGRDLARKRVLPSDILREGENMISVKNAGDTPVRVTRLELELTYR